MREKITVSMAPEILNFVLSESELMGMTKSGLITMALNQYKQQKQALNEIGKLQGIVNQLKEIPSMASGRNKKIDQK